MSIENDRLKKLDLYQDKCFPHIQVIAVEELLESNQVNKDIYLGRYEVGYYQFLEKHKNRAFTFRALMHEWAEDKDINPLSPDTTMLDEDFIDSMLKQMVKEGKLCGAYFKGNYFYYFPPK